MKDKSMIIVRLSDGKEISHYGDIADQLHKSMMGKCERHVVARCNGLSVIYPRRHIVSVTYAENVIKE